MLTFSARKKSDVQTKPEKLLAMFATPPGSTQLHPEAEATFKTWRSLQHLLETAATPLSKGNEKQGQDASTRLANAILNKTEQQRHELIQQITVLLRLVPDEVDLTYQLFLPDWQQLLRTSHAYNSKQFTEAVESAMHKKQLATVERFGHWASIKWVLTSWQAILVEMLA